MSSQPVGYRVVLICLFIGRGSEAAKVGGSVIYGIPFDSWGKISTGTLSCLLLHLRCLFILLYFSLSNLFYIFMYILTDNMQ